MLYLVVKIIGESWRKYIYAHAYGGICLGKLLTIDCEKNT